MDAFIAKPLSRKNIRDFAQDFRRISGLNDHLYIDIVYIVEVLFREVFDPDLNFVIAPTLSMGNLHGVTDPAKKTITIREDVYDRACEGKGRDRFTLAHELGHYILHDEVTVGLARLSVETKLKPFVDPEWQADAFAGELLMPYQRIRGLSARQIASSCGVSYAAADFQRQK